MLTLFIFLTFSFLAFPTPTQRLAIQLGEFQLRVHGRDRDHRGESYLNFHQIHMVVRGKCVDRHVH